VWSPNAPSDLEVVQTGLCPPHLARNKVTQLGDKEWLSQERPARAYLIDKDGIASDLITELSRTRWLFVIARNSSFSYKGRATDIRQIAHELGVRYILEGGVRRSGDRMRVTAELIEAETISHLWADRYDRSVTEVFAVQDEITAAVTTATLPAVADAEQRRAVRRPPESLDAWEAYQRGLWHLGRFTAGADNERAREAFRHSIMLDPAFTSPYSGLSLTYIREVLSYGTPQSSDCGRTPEHWRETVKKVGSGQYWRLPSAPIVHGQTMSRESTAVRRLPFRSTRTSHSGTTT
jgi:TolB-like protein